MSLASGSRLGPYEIVSAIGAGGMGEVYRARDTRLKRDVAIKILPASFVNDPERVARFQREAEVLASLNNPHIAQIYCIEDIGPGGRALVMELVEGEDLSQRIARGAIPFDEALPIAKQVAGALEAAHEQGIIHRDLKPANVKVRPDGTVKVLDFGLAKLTEVNRTGASDASLSPTITSPAMTGVGMLLGTAAYMSPEQARGKPADTRSDIWAFGCVLYEMLTAERPFDGDHMVDMLGAVVRIDPKWDALPPSVPPPIRILIRSCLAKDPQQRIAHITTVRFVLEQTADLAPTEVADVGRRAHIEAATAELRRSFRRRAVMAGVAGSLIAAVVIIGFVWWTNGRVDRAPPPVSRLQFLPSGQSALSVGGFDVDIAITPDGRRVLYVGDRQLFVRALDSLEPVAVASGLPREPFVSPDGQWVGFVDHLTELKKVAITGGPAVTIATLDGPSQGSSWAPDDTIIFATLNGATGLQRIATTGGTATVLTRPDRARGEADHVWPELLPGGRAVLFTITALTGGPDAAQVAVLDLQTGARKLLVRGGTHAHYVSREPVGATREQGGHLVYAAGGALRAVPFDLAHLETTGTSAASTPP